MVFAAWLLLGNFVNSFMEEGLFRGVIMRLFSGKLSLGNANFLQSFLFGLWHLPWTAKAYQLGKLTSTGALAFSIVSNFVPQLALGVVWGYMYLKTNNLWTSWISHTITNSTVNFLHIKTDEGLDSGIALRMMTYIVVMLLSLWLIKYISAWLEMPEVKPWRQS